MAGSEPTRCKCGSTLFVLHRRVNGWVEQHYESASTRGIEHTDMDHLRWGPYPKIMKCADCGAKVPCPLGDSK